jgi:hypothetical protein
VPGKRAQLAGIGLLLALIAPVLAVDRVRLTVDCSKPGGPIRPLHGVNSGPIDSGGLLDLSRYHRDIAFPLTRLHDVHWPNPDVVDMHVVFPNPDADPRRPESYDFAATDDYLLSTLGTRTKLVYRLGESIEHAPRKRHVHPPRDPEKWAAACVGIIRHYNEGWAGGSRHDIRYWEIWNEPDNRPNCWTGSDEDYFRLYATASRVIKQRWPDLKVGGPAVGNTGNLIDGRLRPSPFVAAFLDRCRRDRLPLDFFSWHVYTNDSSQVAVRAAAVRRLLDESGLRQTESHLNEWNYLPDNDWTPVTLAGQGDPRQKFYDRVGGAEGAAFVAATLLRLQDAPLDAANYFNAASNGFGLFTQAGVPKKSFHAFRAFKMLLDAGRRVDVSATGLAACAAVCESGEALTLVVSNDAAAEVTAEVKVDGFPWASPVTLDVWVLDAAHDLEHARQATLERDERTIVQTLPGYGVAVLRIRRPAPVIKPPP